MQSPRFSVPDSLPAPEGSACRASVPEALASRPGMATQPLVQPLARGQHPALPTPALPTHVRSVTGGAAVDAGLLRAWGLALAQMASEYGDSTYETWLRPLELRGFERGEVRLVAPTAYHADWAGRHFAERLRYALSVHVRGVERITLEAAPAASDSGPMADAANQTTYQSAYQSLAGRPAEDPRSTSTVRPAFEPRYSFSSFVVGKSNELAFNAAQTMARAIPDGRNVGFNPLFLYGPTGLGKTHLMHAIGATVQQALPDARILYLSAEKFMVEFLAALRARDTISFKQRLRSCDLLMIDDVQFISGKESTQEEFFHTMNEIINAGRWLVISADRSPQNLEGIEARVQSRLAWGLVADINPADYELRYNILQSKLALQPEAQVPDDVIEFLARKIVANVRELEGALNRVIAYGALVSRPLDIDFTREVLADVLRAHSTKVTIDEIQRRVAEHYALKVNDLLSASRTRAVARPRQVAMYLAKKLTQRSLPEIGRRFGGRDHTTVMHAVKRIETLRTSDHELDRDVDRLSRALDG